jgi:hypothetical protein
MCITGVTLRLAGERTEGKAWAHSSRRSNAWIEFCRRPPRREALFLKLMIPGAKNAKWYHSIRKDRKESYVS